jgi:hypothetical protein
VKRGEENSKNGCWLEGELELKKPRTRASPSCAAHDGHARVPLGIPTALSPMSREFEPVRSLPEVRFALYKGHFARNHLGESPGRSSDRRFRVNEQKPTRNPRAGPEVKSGTRADLKQKHLIRFNQDRLPASRMAREPRTRLDSQEPALKPWLNSETGKCKDDSEMPRRRTPWYNGEKFFKRTLKNFERSRLTLCEPSWPDTRKAKKEIRNSASTYVALHWGKIFLSSRS